MKVILLLVSVMLSHQTMAATCFDRVMAAMTATSTTPNGGLAGALCTYFYDKPQMLRRALVIAKLESDYQGVISRSGKDLGVFQFHTDTIRRYGFDKNYLRSNLEYAMYAFTLVMHDKLTACKHRKVPEACWHSTTQVHYSRYSKNYTAIDKKFKEFL